MDIRQPHIYENIYKRETHTARFSLSLAWSRLCVCRGVLVVEQKSFAMILNFSFFFFRFFFGSKIDVYCVFVQYNVLE